jgi:hypothetical protein
MKRLLAVGLLVAAGACLPAARATHAPTPDHREWAAIPCDDCTTQGVRVETRRSTDGAGRAGRFVVTRVSNLNPYPIVFILDVTPRRPLSGDPDVLTRQWRVSLPAAEHPESSTVLSVDHDPIAGARIYAVERL